MHELQKAIAAFYGGHIFFMITCQPWITYDHLLPAGDFKNASKLQNILHPLQYPNSRLSRACNKGFSCILFLFPSC